MAFKDHATNPDMNVRFYLKVQGLPYIFIAGDIPQSLDSTTFSAPTGYTLLANTFDASRIEDTGCNVSRLDGTASPSSMLIRLLEDRAFTLGGLLSWDKTDGNLANLTASFPFATGAGPWTANVDDTTGFASSGNLYFGRETMFYSSKTGQSFNVTERAKFDPVGNGSSVYRHNSNITSAPRVVADHPRVFIGRYVSVHAFWCNHEGYAVGTAFDDVESWEIYRGIIRELPRPGKDWSSFEFEIESIDSILRTEVGRESRQANLSLSVLGMASDLDINTEVPPDGFYFISGANDRFEFMIEQGSSVTFDAMGPNALSINGNVQVPPSAVLYTKQELIEAFETNIALNVFSSSNIVILELVKVGNEWRLIATNSSGNINDPMRITVVADGENSFLPMLGIFGTTTTVVQATATPFGIGLAGDNENYAAYVSRQSTVIPFVFDPDSNVLTELEPPEPGFCVIGKDEKAEIVSYQTITDLGSTKFPGLLQLNDCRRGLMGTSAQNHFVKHEDLANKTKGPEIRFGIGVENDSFLLTILNLAISTGDGNHGQYDLFAVGTGAPQAPGHFDDTSFLDASLDLTPTEQTISYFLSKPVKLSKLTRDWLTPPGRFIFPRVDESGAYTIGIGRNKPAIPSQTVITLDTSTTHWSDPASYARGGRNIVTGVTLSPLWNFAEEDSSDLTVSFINKDAEAEFGQRNVIEWKLRGYSITPGAALELVKNWSAQLQQRHGRGRVVLEILTDRSAWYVNVADTVALTVPNIPTPDGNRGFTLRYGVVENIVKTYSGDMPGCVIRVVIEDSFFTGAFRPYAPSGRVVSKSGSQVTLEANQYSETGSDADFFQAGDKVVIHNEGDYSSRESHTVVSVSSNVVTLSGTVALTVGSYTAIDVDEYASATTTQQSNAAYISDANGAFSNSDTGHRYI